MSKRNNRQKEVPFRWLHGGPDKIENPHWNSQEREKRLDLRLVFPWGNRNRRWIKQHSGFRMPVE